MKKIKEQEVRVPNQDRNPRSDAFNRELFNYLQTSGWTNVEVQKRIVAIINSIILTGKQNARSQTMIVDYLERGLDVLNVEIQRLEIDPMQKKVVEVEPEDIDDPTQVQESKKRRIVSERVRNHKGHKYRIEKNDEGKYVAKGEDFVTQRLLTGRHSFSTERDAIEYAEKEIEYEIEESTKRRKKILNKIKENINKVRGNDKIKADIKRLLESCKKNEDCGEEKRIDEEEEETKESKPEPEPEEQPDPNEGEVFLNNYRTFMNNYLGIDRGFSDEVISSVTSLVERMVKNLGKDSRKQALINIEVRNLTQSFQRVIGSSEGELTANANSARDELVKYAQTYAGWSGENVAILLNNIFSLLSTSKNKSHLNVLIKKLTDIYKQVS